MPAPRPNIILILADDMGYGDFAAFNGGLSSTPALDALMRESVCFTQHYSASPVCNPSRAALLTGRYPHRTGSIDTLEWYGLDRLALRERTLADELRRAGYATGLVGKWHLGAFDPRYHPARRGFDETVCFRGGMHDYYRWRVEFGETVRRGEGAYLTDVWTEEAIGFIERHRAEPFFLHLAYNAPHTPLQAPEEDIAPFRDKPGLTPAVATLYGMIRRMDAGVARLIETLDRLGLRENTIVLFTSDNGPQFGGKGADRLDRFNCHFNGAKGSTYEGGIRVPMFLRWPAGAPRGTVVDEMVHFCDWLPTLLAMAGVDRSPDAPSLDGVNVLPSLRGERGKVCTDRCWQWNRLRPVVESNAAIRRGDWKLVRPRIAESMQWSGRDFLRMSMYEPERFIETGILPVPPSVPIPPPPPAQLYNIATDPGETADLSAQHPDVTARLLRELETWFGNVEAERKTIRD